MVDPMCWIKFPVEPGPMDLFVVDATGAMVARTPVREDGVEPAGWGQVQYLRNGEAIFGAWVELWREHGITGLTATAAANLLNQLHKDRS